MIALYILFLQILDVTLGHLMVKYIVKQVIMWYAQNIKNMKIEVYYVETYEKPKKE